MRWKESVSLFAAAAQARRATMRAARDHAASVAFQHQCAGAFRHHEPVAVLGERLRRCLWRVVLGRQRRQQRKPHQRFGIDRAVGRHAQRRIGFAAPDRLDAELDRGRAGCACRRQRNWRSLGAEGLGQMRSHRTEHETMMIGRESSAAAGEQQVVIAVFRLADGAAEFEPLRPFDLDRGDCQKQRSGEITLAADAGLRHRFFGGGIGQPLGQVDRGGRLRRQKIHRAGHRGLQAVDRKTRHGADAGFAGGQPGPIVRLAGAERRHNANAGDDDDRPAEFIAWCCHDIPVDPAPYQSA